MQKLSRQDLMTLEQYAVERSRLRAETGVHEKEQCRRAFHQIVRRRQDLRHGGDFPAPGRSAVEVAREAGYAGR